MTESDPLKRTPECELDRDNWLNKYPRDAVDDAYRRGVAAERERCVRVCRALEQLIRDYEDVPDPTDSDGQAVFEEAREALAAIRKGE